MILMIWYALAFVPSCRDSSNASTEARHASLSSLSGIERRCAEAILTSHPEWDDSKAAAAARRWLGICNGGRDDASIEYEETVWEAEFRRRHPLARNSAVEAERARRYVDNPDGYLTSDQVEVNLDYQDKGIGWGMLPVLKAGPYSGYAYRVDRDMRDKALRVVTVFGSHEQLDNELVATVASDGVAKVVRIHGDVAFDRAEISRLAGWH
jgi:hypothetical protein